MEQGFILLHRKLREHWIWKSDNRLKWWIDILMTVNHKDAKVLIGNNLIECKRGQSIHSLETWSKIWGVTKKTVSDFFKLLQKDNMIKIENIKISTRITVCNYDNYNNMVNGKETVSKRLVNGKETVSKRQLHTNNNELNNENNENNENNISELHSDDKYNFSKFNSDIIKISSNFKNIFPENIIKKLTVKQKYEWCDEIEKLNRIDNYDFETIENVINFGRSDNFWKSNFLSIKSLREKKNDVTKFEKIKNAMLQQNTSKNDDSFYNKMLLEAYGNTK